MIVLPILNGRDVINAADRDARQGLRDGLLWWLLQVRKEPAMFEAIPRASRDGSLLKCRKLRTNTAAKIVVCLSRDVIAIGWQDEQEH
ncbi:MAG: hypothetical protein WCT47_16340 [Betaproteobacteria bacterium]|jgi:hypothetical protein